SAGELLIADQGRDYADESARAAFAPPGNVLHEDYEAAGRDFARACRPAQRMNAPVERMATWGWEAAGDRRRAFIDYLVGPHAPGDLVARLREEIVTGRRTGWIAQLLYTSPEIEHLDALTRMLLLTNLGLMLPAPPPSPPPPPPPPPPPGRV